VLLSFVPVRALPPIARFKINGGYAMANSQGKLLYPGLTGFYESALPIAETFLRIVIGVMFVIHVSGKLTAGPAAVAANVMSKNGLEPAILWAYVIIFLELVGGICLIIGLFTRFFAAALAIEMLIALLVVHLPRGYAAGGGGYEYVLLIGAACFLIAIRGGGPYSVDRMVGREL
jgi:putative oxidoreductase